MYLKHFSIGTYGSFLASGNIITIIALLDGGLSLVLTQKLAYSFSKKDIKEFTNLLSSGLIITVTIIFFINIVAFLMVPFISKWIKAEPTEFTNLQIAFLLTAFGTSLGILFNNVSSVFQALLRVELSGAANLISIFSGVISTILGLKLGLGVISIPLGLTIRNFIGVVLLLISLTKVLINYKIPFFDFNKIVFQGLIKSAFPMFGGTISKSLVTNCQLIIINIFINPTASAIYFITSRIYQVCDSFLAPIGSSIFSSISQISSIGDNEKLKSVLINIFKLFNYFSIFLIASSFILNKSFVSLLVGPDKFGGLLLSAILSLNMLIYTRFNFLSVNLFALGLFGKTILFDIISGVIRLLVIFLFIKKIGLIVIPLADFLATTIILGVFLNKFIINKIQLNKFESVKFILSGIEVLFFEVFVCLLCTLFIPNATNWLYFIFYGILLTLFHGVFILLFLGKSREYLFDMAKKVINK